VSITVPSFVTFATIISSPKPLFALSPEPLPPPPEPFPPAPEPPAPFDDEFVLSTVSGNYSWTSAFVMTLISSFIFLSYNFKMVFLLISTQVTNSLSVEILLPNATLVIV